MKKTNDPIPSPEELVFLETLTQLPGVSGQEKLVRDFMKRELSKYADELVFDNLGGVFAVKRCGLPGAPKVMMSGHLDEIGFLVKDITPKGLMHVYPVGRSWNQVLLAQRVTVYSGETGEAFRGTVASIPPHLLSEEAAAKPMPVEQMMVDIGAADRDEVMAQGIRPGDMIVVDGPFVPLFGGRKLMSKAWDNRFGCAMAAEVLREVAKERLKVDLYIGATVQEEVGLRGARTAAYMIDPDLSVVFESSAANDNTGDANAFGQQGGGVLIRFADRTTLTHRGLFKYATRLAEAKGIPHQYFMAAGSTDTGEIHLVRSGVPAITVGVPSRYIHTNSTIMDYRDYLAAKDFSLAVLRDLDAGRIGEIKAYNR